MRRPDGFDDDAVRLPKSPGAAAPRPSAEPPPTPSIIQEQGPEHSGSETPSERGLREPAGATATAPDRRAQERASRQRARDARRAAVRARRERRRFERAEVRRFTRRMRHRRLAWLTAGGVLLTLGALIAVAVFSPLLALRDIQVRGTERLDPQAVQESLEGHMETPLALIDFSELERDLEAFPLIRSYVTEAIPPHTLVIHVTERQPVASVRTDDGYVLVDPAGVSIEVTETRPEGVPMIDIEPDQVGGDVFDAIVEVLLALPEALPGGVDVVSATTRDDVTLALSGAGQRVVWGSADRSELKARVLERLLAAHDPGGSFEFDVTAPLSPVVRPL